MQTSETLLKHRPRKRFGQNFLHDQHVINRIVDSIHPQRGDRLVEIGPGLGALTAPLLSRVDALDVVELDRDLAARLRLEAEMGGDRLGELRVHEADALRFDFGALAAGQSLRVVGNLPYNISTPLIFHLLSFHQLIRDMHFMLQKEVVERMAAEPGGKDYGRLSVMAQYRCAVTPLFGVPPGAFNPPPKVESAIVRLVPHAAAPVDVGDESGFAEIVASAFGQRRKTLRNNLKGLLEAATIEACGIDPGTRAERLTLADFAALSRALGNARSA
jgi:16S rRNA (adenine1518-N6/adenine1519-N6)-dimethyltransferase